MHEYLLVVLRLLRGREEMLLQGRLSEHCGWADTCLTNLLEGLICEILLLRELVHLGCKCTQLVSLLFSLRLFYSQLLLS